MQPDVDRHNTTQKHPRHLVPVCPSPPTPPRPLRRKRSPPRSDSLLYPPPETLSFICAIDFTGDSGHGITEVLHWLCYVISTLFRLAYPRRSPPIVIWSVSGVRWGWEMHGKHCFRKRKDANRVCLLFHSLTLSHIAIFLYEDLDLRILTPNQTNIICYLTYSDIACMHTMARRAIVVLLGQHNNRGWHINLHSHPNNHPHIIPDSPPSRNHYYSRTFLTPTQPANIAASLPATTTTTTTTYSHSLGEINPRTLTAVHFHSLSGHGALSRAAPCRLVPRHTAPHSWPAPLPPASLSAIDVSWEVRVSARYTVYHGTSQQPLSLRPLDSMMLKSGVEPLCGWLSRRQKLSLRVFGLYADHPFPDAATKA
ncbi:uncharacterized protein LY79DRAFT_417610 [Colletotrichum navitas]|uniref:Uncharacterized protein n=1 Tax=Colletotrichum navitas TaxID=681940 RepID=A0AAD8UYZ2_9PEZI|nr:uncharacterized protein LY79DRAFT_417610 [Colletotrichum navitas]KAK1573073.1 hypothetical protein LY79DRAFT_417610 [Colletotrichum navitas]